MSSLSTLKPRLTSLDWLAQLRLHEEIRVSRLIYKAPKTKKAAKKRTERVGIKKNLTKLTPEEAKKLLDLIEKRI